MRRLEAERLKSENDVLQNKINLLENTIEEQALQITSLEQENKQLKAKSIEINSNGFITEKQSRINPVEAFN